MYYPASVFQRETENCSEKTTMWNSECIVWLSSEKYMYRAHAG